MTDKLRQAVEAYIAAIDAPFDSRPAEIIANMMRKQDAEQALRAALAEPSIADKLRAKGYQAHGEQQIKAVYSDAEPSAEPVDNLPPLVFPKRIVGTMTMTRSTPPADDRDRRIASLERTNKIHTGIMNEYIDKCKALEAENAKLRAALEKHELELAEEQSLVTDLRREVKKLEAALAVEYVPMTIPDTPSALVTRAIESETIRRYRAQQQEAMK